MKTDETNKRETMESFLAEGMVLVQLDSRVDGVQVPDHLAGDPTLRLNISGRFGLPLDLDEWGIHATLTFQGDPFECKLPWNAIYIVISHVTGEPCLFPSDVPPEYVSEALGHLKNTGIATAAAKAEPVEEAAEPEQNYLRLVPVSEESQEPATQEASSTPAQDGTAVETPDGDDGDDDNDPTPDPPKKPFLSVVK